MLDFRSLEQNQLYQIYAQIEHQDVVVDDIRWKLVITIAYPKHKFL